MSAFERRIGARDATSQLLGQLTHLALSAGVRNLLIDSTSARVAVTSPGAGPRVAGASEPDPRIALFKTPLVYSSVPMSFDSGYEALGELLWQFRDMPTLVEIRALDVKPRAVQNSPGASSLDREGQADGTVSVSLTLFAYARKAASGLAPSEPGGRQ
jgi:hypothetical protein